MVGKVQRGDYVDIGLGIVHHGRVHEERAAVGRLVVLQVDGAGHRFQAVHHRWRALAHLDALQPGTGNIGQPERRQYPAQDRPVLVQHLRIDAGEAQEPYLAGASGGIGKANGDADGVLEALCQVAAGHLHKAGRRDDFRAQVLPLGKVVTLVPADEHRRSQGIDLISGTGRGNLLGVS